MVRVLVVDWAGARETSTWTVDLRAVGAGLLANTPGTVGAAQAARPSPLPAAGAW